MADYVSGINSKKLETLIVELYDYVDELSVLLQDIEILVSDTKKYYISNDGDFYRNRFTQFSANFNTILTNLRKYPEDLNFVRQSYIRNDTKNVDIFHHR